MNFDEYQKRTADTAIFMQKVDEAYRMDPALRKKVELSYLALGMGEAGEIQNKVKKLIRDDQPANDKFKADMAKEIGDLLWYASQMATALGLELNEIARHNIEKLADRKVRGVLGGSGDNR